MKGSIGFGVIFFTLLLLESHFGCDARDTITVNSSLSDNGETLVSAGRKFELGFFTPEGRTDTERYVGIWYCSNPGLPRTVVWVANRNVSIPRGASPGVLAIAKDGNLKVLDRRGTPYFSTDLRSSSGLGRSVKLLDSGNLALIDGESGTYMWQSFLHPTDTFLPGMLMDDNLKLISWASPGNPKVGNFTFQRDQEDNKQFLITNGTVLLWKSDQSDGLIHSVEMPSFVALFLSNFTYYGNHLKIPPANNYSAVLASLANTRLLMNSSGDVQFYRWDHEYDWSLLWSKPNDSCSVYNPCGIFGVCSNGNGRFTCECLSGFEPVSVDDWNSGEFSRGCVRKSPCKNNTEVDTFLDLKLMKVGSQSLTFPGFKDEKECRDKCLAGCTCGAFSYVVVRKRYVKGNCSIWTTDPGTLQKENRYTFGSISISVRVTASDIKSTSRDCESCGQYILPYPLSNGHDCGDPSYYSFFCDKSTGNLQFRTLKGSYRVISINKDNSTLVIQDRTGNASLCDARNSADVGMLLNPALFNVTKWCYSYSIYDESKIEIGWKPPLEPLCNSSRDCLHWPDSNCNASTDGKRRCLCKYNYRWDGLTSNCATATDSMMKKSERPNLEKKLKLLIVSITVIVVFLSVSFSCISFRRKIRVMRRVPDLDNGERQTPEMIVTENRVIDVPFFSLESIIVATNNFSDSNKLGQGGFGPVYKGMFHGEKEIAVKRLSSHSGQGIDEFQNEVVLIAKLQHRNLVRLLGYCMEGSEKLLLYEYMPNKSLDTFIFDQGRSFLLDWKKRFDIILGIARGLLYLHQDSRLRVIHRDLKTSNILLDEDLTPKISDFGLARIVGGKETEANTNKVVGTYGYMSPEYALEGLFSIKSDVYSFGVILLEIISGKRNLGLINEVLSLLGYAWKLWQERRPMEFIDKKLWESYNSSSSEVLKCINIGLLCVQEDHVDRPTMANVLTALSSETATLPHPTQPAFVSRKLPSSTPTSSSSKLGSINELTLSVEGR